MEVHNLHPVVVFYDFHSVPMPPSSVKQLFNFVSSKLPGQPNRIAFSCDVTNTPKNIRETAEAVTNCEIQHFSVARKRLIAERILRYTSMFNGSQGTLALISDSEDAVEIVKEIREEGWKVLLFHPPKHSMTLLRAASKAFQLPIHSAPPSIYQKQNIRKIDLAKKEMPKRQKWIPMDSGDGPLTPTPVAPRSTVEKQFHAPNNSPRPLAFHRSKDTSATLSGGVKMIDLCESEPRLPGPQCPQWNNKIHSRRNCDLYHPRKLCRYYPKCHMAAMVCYYGHPFCSDGGECRCEGGLNPQLNHISP